MGRSVTTPLRAVDLVGPSIDNGVAGRAAAFHRLTLLAQSGGDQFSLELAGDVVTSMSSIPGSSLGHLHWLLKSGHEISLVTQGF